MVRVKNRYLLVNILYPDAPISNSKANLPALIAFNQPTTDSLNSQVLIKAIRSNALELFGEYGAGAIADSLQVKYLSPATSTFILRVARAHYRIVWATLSFMDSVPVKDGKNCIFRVVRVSGTIRKAEKEAITRTRAMILRARRAIGDQSDAALSTILGLDERNVDSHYGNIMMGRSDSDESDGTTDDG